MREIPITKGMVAIVDDEDYEYLSKWKWYYSCGYAKRKIWKNGIARSMSMHRDILKPTRELHIDHINHNGLDNRKNNLRLCTQSQNMGNSIMRSDNTSGKRGVIWNKGRHKWMAQINCGGKHFYLGLFVNMEDACNVYDKKAEELFGEYSYRTQG